MSANLGLRGARRPIDDFTEMHRVFNCGIGMVVVVAADDADEAITRLTGLGEHVSRIGEIVDRPAGAAQTEVR